MRSRKVGELKGGGGELIVEWSVNKAKTKCAKGPCLFAVFRISTLFLYMVPPIRSFNHQPNQTGLLFVHYIFIINNIP